MSSLRIRALAVATLVLSSACRDDAVLAPANDALDLGACTNLSAPSGTRLAQHLYAKGVQIYKWSGTAWTFVEPSAVLYADAEQKIAVGTHFAGPSWASAAGSKVVGSVLDRCTPNASSIPWLILGATSTEGSGAFQGTTHIQRVRTVGGIAPTTPGTTVGEVTSVPYTAEYYFYRADAR